VLDGVPDSALDKDANVPERHVVKHAVRAVMVKQGGTRRSEVRSAEVRAK